VKRFVANRVLARPLAVGDQQAAEVLRPRLVVVCRDLRASDSPVPLLPADRPTASGRARTRLRRSASHVRSCAPPTRRPKTPGCGARRRRASIRNLLAQRTTPELDILMDTTAMVSYDWREFDPEETLRFFALKLGDVKLIKSTPQQIIAQGSSRVHCAS